MKQGTRTTINVNGNKLDVIFLGKGTWTNAYRDEGGRSAFLNVRRGRGRIFGGTVDYSKDILVNCNSIPHLPAVERLGGVDGNEWFLSPLYQPLKAANVKSWTQYRALEAAVKEVTDGLHMPAQEFTRPDVSPTHEGCGCFGVKKLPCHCYGSRDAGGICG